MIIEIQDIIDQCDPDNDGEINAVSKTGKLIAERLDKYEWMQWTKFPDEFRCCRSEAELYQAIDNYNNWLRQTGFGVE
jgi:hypothetical protein